MNETQYTQFQRLGMLPVDVALLEQLFCLPEGYHIVNASPAPNGIINFTLESEALPEAIYRDLPCLTLRFTVETLPDQDPAYRKITTEVKPL